MQTPARWGNCYQKKPYECGEQYKIITRLIMSKTLKNVMLLKRD